MSLYQVRYLMSPNVTWVEFVAGERRSRDQDPAVFSSAGLLLLCLLLFLSWCLKPWEKKARWWSLTKPAGCGQWQIAVAAESYVPAYPPYHLETAWYAVADNCLASCFIVQ
jgi:hypothetical protein